MKCFAVAYAHVIRYEKAATPSEACRLAYGLVDADRMTVRQLPRSPKSMSQKSLNQFNHELAARHEEKTGSKVQF